MFSHFVTFYLANEYWFAAMQLALAMLGMGATLKIKDFVNIAKAPKALIKGLIVQLLLVSLIAFIFIHAISLPVGVAIGIALCAAVPGGTTSNIFTHIAKGNSALSVSMTTISSLACLFSAPLILAILISQHLPANFAMPSAIIARDIVFNLLIPLAIGMWLLRCYPAIAQGIATLCIRVSLLVIVAIVVGASGAGRLDLDLYGTQNILLIAGFILTLMTVSWFVPKIMKLPTYDTVAISMEVTVRNINLALLIHVAIFTSGQLSQTVANQALLTLLLFGALQMLCCIPLIIAGRLSHATGALLLAK